MKNILICRYISEKSYWVSFLFILTEINILLAQPISIQANVDKKIAPNGAAYNYFGSAVAIDSCTMMIGAIGDDNYKGGVYVYTKTDSGWIQTQFLTDPNAVPGEFFGNDIDICGNSAAIGAYGRGAVITFQKINGFWHHGSTIFLEEDHYFFGASIDLIDYNHILIGSPCDVWAQGGGRAYLYGFNQSWGVICIFNKISRRFGSAVCSIPDTLPAYLIGDYFVSSNQISGVGAVYLNVWNGSTWTESTFTPPDPTPGCGFGWDISSPNSTTIIISAYNYGTDSLTGSGAVYVYKFNPSVGWQNIQKIIAPDLSANMHFGNSISAYGDKLIIGAFYSDDYKGAAYLYKWIDNGYTFQRKITAEDGEAGDQFGNSVSIFDQNCLIGSPQDSTNGNINQGSAYLYSPKKIGQALNLNLFASTLSTGNILIDTSTISNPGQLPPNIIINSNNVWNVSAQNGFTFQDGKVGTATNKLGKNNHPNTSPCWLKRANELSPWEYIGGEVIGNYLYSTIPFDNFSQFIIAERIDTTTSVEENDFTLPSTFELYQNYPNPYNPSTKISWQSPVAGHLTIKLFDVLGNEIETIVEGYYEAGNHSTLYIVNSTLSSGVYFYQLKAGDPSTGSGQSFIQTKKMILLR